MIFWNSSAFLWGEDVLTGLSVFLPSLLMGWEVFHQVILILTPTPIYLTELTSKREGNCNVMITGPVDHGLHVILSRELNPRPTHDWFIFSFFTASAMNSSSHRRIVATTSSPLYRLGHQSALALSRAEVLRVTKYLQTNAFPLGSGGAKGISSRSTKESHWKKPQVKW